MKNIQINREGEFLNIRIKLSETHGPSKSGKTTIIATTEGNVKLDSVGCEPGTCLGLNLYKARG